MYTELIWFFLKLVLMVMQSTHGFLNPSELFSKNKL